MSIPTPTPEPEDLPADQRQDDVEEHLGATKAERPEQRSPGGQRGEGLHQVFAATLLAVVGAYGITNSITLTVIAAVLALLVTLIVARTR